MFGMALIGHRLSLVVEQQRGHAAPLDRQHRPLRAAHGAPLVDHAAEPRHAVLRCRKAAGRLQRLPHLGAVKALYPKAVARHAAGAPQPPFQQCRQLVYLAVGRFHSAGHESLTRSPG